MILRDLRCAPGLVVNVHMPAIDEGGAVLGMLVIGDSMVVRTYDSDGPWVQAWTEVDAGSSAVTLPWDIPAPGIGSTADLVSPERARAKDLIGPSGS